MLKTYKYRLYPKKSQITVLNQTLEQCRMVYNRILVLRNDAWEREQKRIGYYESKKLLPIWKQEYPSLKNVHSQVLQDVVLRVEKAYKSFFRRVKLGETPGYPRFKQFGRYDSITYTQHPGFELNGQKLTLSKIGDIQVITHRVFSGEVKTCTIKRSHTGKWFASILVETNENKDIYSNNKPHVGIDFGISNFLTLSTGQFIPNPRFFKTDETLLKRAQRKVSKQIKGSSLRKRSVMTVSKIHERIANRREDLSNKISRDLVDNYSIIVFEDLNIKEMVQNKIYAKSIHDVAWNTLLKMTQNKAEDAGCCVILVPPYYTSQTCSMCGFVHENNRKSQSEFLCLRCGHKEHADFNASKVILGLGLQSVASTQVCA
jgi:putative transposase